LKLIDKTKNRFILIEQKLKESAVRFFYNDFKLKLFAFTTAVVIWAYVKSERSGG